MAIKHLAPKPLTAEGHAPVIRAVCFTKVKNTNTTPYIDEATCERCLKMESNISNCLASGQLEETRA